MLLNRSSTCCPACPSSTQGGKDLSRARGLARSNARAIMRAGVALHRPTIPGTVSISCHCRSGIASAISSAVERCSGPASPGSGACVRSASRHRSSISQSVSLPNCTAFRRRCRAGSMPPRRDAPARKEPPPITKEPNSSHDAGQSPRGRTSASLERSLIPTRLEQRRCCRRHKATTRSGEAPCLK
jgi:hypothetical protein